MSLPFAGLRGILGRTALWRQPGGIWRSAGSFMRFSAVARPSLSVAAIKFEKSYIRLSSSTALATAKDEPSYKGQAPKPGVNFFYVLLGLGGVGLAGAMLWGTGTALFSQSSAHRIQARAVEKLEQNDEVKANIGTPFSVGQVTSLEYQKEGRDVRVPIRFQLSGPQGEALVFVEGWEKDGKMLYSYAVVSLLRKKKKILVDPNE